MFERKSDCELNQQIVRELKLDSRVKSAALTVNVKDGIAILSGVVPAYFQKLEAQNAAHRVVGILDVVNDIEVIPVERFVGADTQIANAVRNALEWDALVPNESIQSTVSEGWVTLEGEVDYWRERGDAEDAIRRLSGVVGVTNRITVRKRPIDSGELRGEIEVALGKRAEREAERLRVEIHDGTVDLFGRVHSWQERRAVLGAVGHAPGVMQVRDHLRIDPYF